MMMNDYYYNEETDTLYVYKTISVGLLLHFKKHYTHVEVRQKPNKKRW